MILITGYRGFIGRGLTKHLFSLTDGELSGIDLKDGYDLLSTPGIKDVQTVYHLAAQTSVESSWTDPVHDANNLRLMARIVQLYPKAKIIHTNSCAALDPKSPYGFSKKASADYMKKFHKGEWVDCVLPNVYGPGSNSVVDIFKGKDEVTVYGDGKQVRDYVHVHDIHHALLLAQDWPTGEYHLGSGKGTTVLQLAEGKKIDFKPARKEEREVVLKNTTPNWKPTIKVLGYLND